MNRSSPPHHSDPDSRERVLAVAERLFVEQGYSAVKLRHVAEALGVKESSLYYHFPKGKEQMYVAVMRRHFERHHTGMRAAIAAAGDDWVAQLRAAARWLLSQHTLDVVRMNRGDLPAIDPAAAYNLEEAAYAALNLPLRTLLEAASARGEARVADADLLAGAFISMIAGIDIIRGDWNARSKPEMADLLIDSWADGLRARLPT